MEKRKITYSAFKGPNCEYLTSCEFEVDCTTERGVMMMFAVHTFNFQNVAELEYFVNEHYVLVLGITGKAGEIIGQIVPNE